MKHTFYIVSILSVLGASASLADEQPVAPAPTAAPAATIAPAATEPPPIPRTHVDSTVMGDSAGDQPDARNAPISLDNRHGFEAGAPELVRATSSLQLSAEQQAKMHSAIEQADAGAAMLIKRENAVRQMLAATTPENPGYAKLQSEQASQDSLWNNNRESLRHAIADLLTPAQRAQFERSQSKQ